MKQKLSDQYFTLLKEIVGIVETTNQSGRTIMRYRGTESKKKIVDDEIHSHICVSLAAYL